MTSLGSSIEMDTVSCTNLLPRQECHLQRLPNVNNILTVQFSLTQTRAHVSYTVHWFTGLATINSNVMKAVHQTITRTVVLLLLYMQCSKLKDIPALNSANHTVPNLSTKSQLSALPIHPSIHPCQSFVLHVQLGHYHHSHTLTYSQLRIIHCRRIDKRTLEGSCIGCIYHSSSAAPSSSGLSSRPCHQG